MTKTLLLDANVLIALSFADHVHHKLATDWFANLKPRFSTCPMTQGALVRFTLRNVAGSAETAKSLLLALEAVQDTSFGRTTCLALLFHGEEFPGTVKLPTLT